HFMQKMEDEPSIEFQNMNRAYDGLREDQFNDEYFDAWCQGQTGYPLVDACMRALHQTGWINFRMRAMLVSFASYHLWLHWRKPATYLARLFLDYEPGIHYSQIQMQSGVTGINTVRIYSPIKQVADQDPQGIFIRKYVPELADIPDKHLAEPHQMNAMEQTFYGCKIGVDYPKPIVDHLTQYKMARDRIHQIKKAPQTRAESNKVYLKHGSRKTPMSKR
ncbi:FAD-binding domain-containing protein, partial [Pirellulaceae bacterium]|nr:FAD-binding domain-containing protein [Pirellulaceae bacterium]